jgi:hypothetical protein
MKGLLVVCVVRFTTLTLELLPSNTLPVQPGQRPPDRICLPWQVMHPAELAVTLALYLPLCPSCKPAYGCSFPSILVHKSVQHRCPELNTHPCTQQI